MGKRGNGEGSITKRKDGRYMARYVVYTENGVKRKTIYGKKGEKREDVAKRLTHAMSDRNQGLVFDADTVRLEDYLKSWLETAVQGTVRPRTYERYEQIVNSHLIPVLGRIKLKSLTPAQVRGLYKDREKGNDEENRKPLSPRTVRYIHVTLHKALKQAVSDGLIPRNVTESVKAPSLKSNDSEVRPLTTDQVHKLFAAATGERLEALYIVAVHTGMRQGELLGLRWEDIDLDGKPSLQVRRTLDKGVFAAPKTSKSRRRVDLTPSSADALLVSAQTPKPQIPAV